MKKVKLLIVLAFSVFVISSCDEEITSIIQSVFTAKENVSPVVSSAVSWSSDAKLTGIYGWNVSTNGTVDLLKPNENAFVYIVQSDSKGENEFYVPVYAAGPIQSPINFTTMLGFVQDAGAKSILETIFGKLATTNISTSASYPDSPTVLSAMLARSDVQTFRSSNPGSKIDMFLVPSVTLPIPGSSGYADWIVNFNSSSSSLVLYRNSQTTIIVEL